jgi:hypothetical protein
MLDNKALASCPISTSLEKLELEVGMVDTRQPSTTCGASKKTRDVIERHTDAYVVH